MRRGPILVGLIAAVVAVVALWLVFGSRAPAPSTPVPPPAGNAASNTVPGVERPSPATGVAAPPPAPAAGVAAPPPAPAPAAKPNGAQ